MDRVTSRCLGVVHHTFYVAVENILFMAVKNALKQLLHDQADLVVIELHQTAVDESPQVVVHVLEHLHGKLNDIPESTIRM